MKKLSKDELVAYTYAYLSYLFRIKTHPINRIFLFGSVARGDFDENSDVDIFIDTEQKNEKKLKKNAERALNRFYELEREKWRLKSIPNQISLKVGSLNKWKLKESIETDGIILYSTASSPNLKKYMLFNLEPVTPLKRRMKVIRNLFGRKELGYKEHGLVAKYGGKTFNPRSFMVPSEGQPEIAAFLAREKVKFSFEEIWK